MCELAELLKRYSFEHLRKMAEYRINLLYSRIETNKSHKIDNSALKPIEEIMRLLGERVVPNKCSIYERQL